VACDLPQTHQLYPEDLWLGSGCIHEMESELKSKVFSFLEVTYTSTRASPRIIFNMPESQLSPVSIIAVNPIGEDFRTTFSYTPLDPSVDGIRLLVLAPAQDIHSNIICSLRHVTFAQKPKYEALSYTWGSEAIRHRILVNGRGFYVAQNLFDALKHLRDTLKEKTLWVDAICINQSDVAERNRQIGMMPYVYMRAKVVLVWLGFPGGLEQGDVSYSLWEKVFGTPLHINRPDAPTLLSLLTVLCSQGYWRRVWIVQEIGLARKIIIQFGVKQIDWKTFINTLQEYLDDCLPLKLHKQLEKKYDEGHKLQALIESHTDSLCKEPRDHIYGFVGLAVDAQEGFPMDYGKTPYEVWKDVVRFKNMDQPKDEDALFNVAHDTLNFARIVRELLGGTGIASDEEVAKDFRVKWIDRGEIWVPARMAGKIVHLGPTYQEIISDLKSTAKWRASINQWLPTNSRPSAREESDFFLEVLEDIEGEDLRAIESYERDISWGVSNKPDCMKEIDGEFPRLALGAATSENLDTDSTDPRMYLLASIDDTGDSPPSYLGLAPSQACVGDYVVLVHGIEKALVVRYLQKEQGLKIVGTAIPADNRYKARAAKKQIQRGIEFLKGLIWRVLRLGIGFISILILELLTSSWGEIHSIGEV